jgi:pyrimidine operon attenuation protein/uracil phosphoribosyltransferase
MGQLQTILLDQKQIGQKINRIAYQVYEDNVEESEIIIAGILQSGFILAKKIEFILKNISPIKTRLVEVAIDKHSHLQKEIKLSIPQSELQGKTVLLVDDVMDSGKTMIYALKPFLQADIKKIRTAVLVDRNHKRYPIAADFVGIRLATTLQEHITAILDNENESVFLS